MAKKKTSGSTPHGRNRGKNWKNGISKRILQVIKDIRRRTHWTPKKSR